MSVFPSCTVCRKDFTSEGQVPFLLPCLHAVCETCVSSKAVIYCCSCNVTVNPQKTPLCKDLIRKRDILQLTIKKRPGDLLCTHEEDGNQAVCWCQDCEEMLCESCQKMHQSFKVTRGHTVLDVHHALPNTVDEVKYCGIHKQYPLDTYDKTCKIFICVRCYRGDHADHETVDVEKMEEIFKNRIQVHLQEIESVELYEQEMLKKTLNHIKSTEEVTSQMKQKITGTFKTLRQLLDRREQELVNKLELQTQKIQQEAKLKKAKIVSNQNNCKRVKGYVTSLLRYPNLRDILPMQSAIEEKTRSMVSTKSKAEKMYILPNFNSSGGDTFKSFISYVGDVEAVQTDIPVSVAAPVKVETPDLGPKLKSPSKIPDPGPQLKTPTQDPDQGPRHPTRYSRTFLLQQQFTRLSVQRPRSLTRVIPEIIPDTPFTVPDDPSSAGSRVPELPTLPTGFLKPVKGAIDSVDLSKEVDDLVTMLKKTSKSEKGTKDDTLSDKGTNVNRDKVTDLATSQPQGMHRPQRYMTPTAQPNQMYSAMYPYMGQTQGQGYPATASVMVQPQGQTMYQQSQRMPTPQQYLQNIQTPQLAAATAAQYPNQATQQYGSTAPQQFQAVYYPAGGQVPIAQPARPPYGSGMTAPTGTLQKRERKPIIDPNSGQQVHTT